MKEKRILGVCIKITGFDRCVINLDECFICLYEVFFNFDERYFFKNGSNLQPIGVKYFIVL